MCLNPDYSSDTVIGSSLRITNIDWSLVLTEVSLVGAGQGTRRGIVYGSQLPRR